MHCFGFFAVFFAALAVAIVAPGSETTDIDNVLSGFTIGALTWTGSVVEGGEEYTISGTAEEIVDQILTLNPAFELVEDLVANSTIYDELTMGNEPDKNIVNCNPSSDWHYAPTKQLRKEAKYLKSLGNRVCNASPGECARVSCSYNTAVYLCNLRKQNWGPSCNHVGDLVLAIADMCLVYEHGEMQARALVTDPGNFHMWAGFANPHC